jgi:hypothetical protein
MKAPIILLALSMGFGLPAHAGQTSPSSGAEIQLAQAVEIGPDGVRIAPRRSYDRSYDEDSGYRRYGRGYGGEYGRECRTVTIRETDDFGREVTKRIRRCG